MATRKNKKNRVREEALRRQREAAQKALAGDTELARRSGHAQHQEVAKRSWQEMPESSPKKMELFTRRDLQGQTAFGIPAGDVEQEIPYSVRKTRKLEVLGEDIAERQKDIARIGVKAADKGVVVGGREVAQRFEASEHKSEGMGRLASKERQLRKPKPTAVTPTQKRFHAAWQQVRAEEAARPRVSFEQALKESGMSREEFAQASAKYEKAPVQGPPASKAGPMPRASYAGMAKEALKKLRKARLAKAVAGGKKGIIKYMLGR